MTDRYGCEARQHSDQKVCTRCNLMWDMNDDDPPPCKNNHDIELEKIQELLGNERSAKINTVVS